MTYSNPLFIKGLNGSYFNIS